MPTDVVGSTRSQRSVDAMDAAIVRTELTRLR